MTPAQQLAPSSDLTLMLPRRQRLVRMTRHQHPACSRQRGHSSVMPSHTSHPFHVCSLSPAGHALQLLISATRQSKNPRRNAASHWHRPRARRGVVFPVTGPESLFKIMCRADTERAPIHAACAVNIGCAVELHTHRSSASSHVRLVQSLLFGMVGGGNHRLSEQLRSCRSPTESDASGHRNCSGHCSRTA